MEKNKPVEQKELASKHSEKEKKEITKDMLLGEIIVLCPDSAQVMMSHGLHCFGCGMSAYESLESGCRVHGMDDSEIEAIVKEVNELLKSE